MTETPTFEEYSASLFANERERFRPMEEIRDRWQTYYNRAKALSKMTWGQQAQSEAREAEQKLLRSLLEEDYRGVRLAHADLQVEKSVQAFMVVSIGQATFKSLACRNTLCDFVDARQTQANLYDWMAARTDEEINRVRPLEIERFTRGIPWITKVLGQGLHKRELGDNEPEPVERQSVVLKELLAYKTSLEKAAGVARNIPGNEFFYFQPFEDVLKILDAQAAN